MDSDQVPRESGSAARGNEPDTTLVRRVLGGDEAAFGALFNRYEAALRNRLHYWLPARVQRRVSISDVVQEARVIAHRRLRDFAAGGGEGSFRNWVLRIVELKAREAVRRHAGTAKRAVGREVTRGERADTAQFMGRDTSPSGAAIAAERAAQVREAMAALPPDYREILRLVKEECLTMRAAGERMGRSREAAKKLYGRALLRLTDVFRERGGVEHG